MNGSAYCGHEPYEGLDSELQRADSECGKNVHIGSDLSSVEFVFQFLLVQNSITARRGEYPVENHSEDVQGAKNNGPDNLVGLGETCSAEVRDQSNNPHDKP